MKDNANKARGGGLGAALAAIIVYGAQELGVNLGPIADPIALVITVALGGLGGAWIAPPNQPKNR